MRMSFRWIVIGFLAIIVISAGFLVKTSIDLGAWNEVEPSGEEFCRPVPGLESSEDIVIDTETGTAYISSLQRRFPPGDQTNGAIYRYRIGRDEYPVKATPDLPFPFQPLGMGLTDTAEGLFLFSVNRVEENGCVEKFRIEDLDLVHEDSICNAAFHSANDVAPLDGNTFYLTNDHGSRSGVGRWWEDLAGIGRGEVLYWDGSSPLRVAGRISYANGIAHSPDKTRVYVAATRSGRVHIYTKQPGYPELELLETLETGTGVDNINVDPGGNLWIGAHPNLIAFLDYSRDPDHLSPSEVLMIRPVGEYWDVYTIKSIYRSKGEYLSGSSTAAVWEDTLLIGSVFDRRMLECSVPELLNSLPSTENAAPYSP